MGLVRRFVLSGAFLSRDGSGGFPPASWRLHVPLWRFLPSDRRLEASLNLRSTASAVLYLAIPPRRPSPEKFSLSLVVPPCSQKPIIYILYSSSCRSLVKDA